MEKIRIAITADTFMGNTAFINQRNAPYAPRTLTEILASLSALPIILPDAEGLPGEDFLSLYDGLVLSGGPDTAPYFYGEEPSWKIGPMNEKRDRFELEILRAAVSARKPVLGICRGMQLINIFYGGNVWQDLSKCPGAFVLHAQKAPGDCPTHSISMTRGSLLEKLLGSHAFVNSRHHQSIRQVGAELTVTAKAPDGVVEGIESENGLLLGVQWHPENLEEKDKTQLSIFRWLIETAKRQRKSGSFVSR